MSALVCFGCGRGQDEVALMVAGRARGCAICEKCARLAAAIVDERLVVTSCLTAYREAQRADPSLTDEAFVARILAVIRAERAVTFGRDLETAVKRG